MWLKWRETILGHYQSYYEPRSPCSCYDHECSPSLFSAACAWHVTEQDTSLVSLQPTSSVTRHGMTVNSVKAGHGKIRFTHRRSMQHTASVRYSLGCLANDFWSAVNSTNDVWKGRMGTAVPGGFSEDDRAMASVLSNQLCLFCSFHSLECIWWILEVSGNPCPKRTSWNPHPESVLHPGGSFQLHWTAFQQWPDGQRGRWKVEQKIWGEGRRRHQNLACLHICCWLKRKCEVCGCWQQKFSY